MIPRWLLVFLGWLGAVGGGMWLTVPAQGQAPAVVATDDRAARIAERYKQMLAANPAEGIALDRLWKSAEDRSATGDLIEEYHKAADDAQKPPNARLAAALVYGHLLKRVGRLDDAQAAYKQAADFDVANPLPPLALADLAIARGKPADAAECYDTAIAKLPKDDRRQNDLLLKLGSAQLAAGQALAAAQTWERIIARDPNNTALRRQLADNYEKNKLPERAIGHYEYIVAHGAPEERALALRELGRLQQARGNFDAARDALERGLNLTARDNWLHGDLQLRLIRLYQRAGRAPELEARWKAEVEKTPRDLGAYLRLEALAEAQADPAAQRAWLEKIVALAPGDREDTLRLARLLADAGERERAASLYDGLLKTRPDDLDLIFARAEIDLQLNQPKAAVDRIEARVARANGDESAANAALEFFLRRRLDDAAERRLRADLARQPKAEEPALALAKFYFNLRRPADARAALDAMIAQAPAANPAARAERLTRAADIYKEQNLADDALRCWKQATELQPKAPAPLLAAGETLLSRGDAAGAAAMVEAAVDATPDGPERVEAEKKLFQVLQSASAAESPEEDPEIARLRVLRSRVSRGGAGVVMRLGPGFTGAPNAPPEKLPTEGLLGKKFAQLDQEAREHPTAPNWLRLARWQSWAHAANAALESAQKAAEADPASLPARELLVNLYGERAEREQAAKQLREIIALDPARKAASLKQIANLKLDDSDNDGAVAIFQELERAAPGSPAALTDLALAFQRADRWADALAVWERAYALPALTPQQRADIRRPLLLALDRMENFPREFDVLFAAVDAQTDLAAKQDVFRELLAFCQKRQMMGQLQSRVEEQLAAQPQDYFLLTALADFRRASGRERDAYDLLTQAYYSSTDPAKSLRALAESAESLGEMDAALTHQRRLTAMTGQASMENLQKLAALEEANLDPDAAARTWETIIGKFPRDPDALGKAEEFFEKIDRPERARALLRQIAALDGADLKQVLRLGQLDAGAGDATAAIAAFEKVLTRAEAEALSDAPKPLPIEAGEIAADPFPAGVPRSARFLFESGVRSAGRAAAKVAENPDRQLRLTAIREESRLLFPTANADPLPNGKAPPAPSLTPPQTQWLARWRQAVETGARNEPLWAFYYSGQKAPLMELLSHWAVERPNDPNVLHTFLTIGLRVKDYARLASWTWEIIPPDKMPDTVRAERLIAALGQCLAGNSEADAGMVEALFPRNVDIPYEELWRAANQAFAARQRYAEAVELGNRALGKIVANRPNYALEISHWNLILGRSDAARAVLLSAIAKGEADTLEAESSNGLFTALREYFLLLPENQRGAFLAEYLSAPRSSPAQTVLASVLLHGLMGDEEAARGALDQLLAMRMLASGARGAGSVDERRWNYLLANGSQLEEWNLPNLAIYLWRRVLAQASGFERQDSALHDIIENVRVQLADLESAAAPDPQQARERIDEYLSRQPDSGMAQTLATELLVNRPQLAALVYQYLCRSDTGLGSWRALLTAYETAGNRPALERVLQTLIGERSSVGLTFPLPPPDVGTSADLCAKLAYTLEQDGDAPGAQRMLTRVWRENPAMRGTGFLLARSYAKSGRQDDAARVWRELLPGDANGGAHLELAALEQERGNAREGIRLLKEGLSSLKPGAETGRLDLLGRLADLYLAAGDSEGARALTEQTLRDGPFEALPAIAAAYAKHGQATAARECLTAGVRRTRDTPLRFRLQREALDDCEDAATLAREAKRLREFAGNDQGLQETFLAARSNAARQLKLDAWLEGELTREWKDGRGEWRSGQKLIALYLQTGKEAPLREIVARFIRHGDVPEVALNVLQITLAGANRADLAAPVAEMLARRYPQSDVYVVACARAFWQTGRRAEAAALLNAVEATAVFRDGAGEEAAHVWLDLGERGRAAAAFRRAAARDPLAIHNPASQLQLAKLALADKDLPAARRWLRAAYRNPACADFGPLLDYLNAAGQLEDTRRSPGGDLPLTPLRRGDLAAAICARLDAAGKPDAARRLLLAHSELMSVAPELAGLLRGKTSSEQRVETAAALENVIVQNDPPPLRLARELAGLYVQWAADERAPENGPAGQDAAEAHLARALQLRPDDFSIASDLAKLCLEKKQPTRAAEALHGFLTPDALPAERAEAQRLLGRKDEG